MATTVPNADQSPRDLRIFAALWVVFFGILGRAALGSGPGLLYAAAFTGGCLMVSLVLNREQPRREQVLGFAIPLTLLGIWGLPRLAAGAEVEIATAQRTVLGVLWGIGTVGGGVMLASLRAARPVYRRWMAASLPIGWTVSSAVLALVYFGVITPIALVMKAIGRDPMERRFDRSATTYWVEHRQEKDRGRYLRQY